MTRYCPSCGSNLNTEDKFCLNCGIKIESKNQIMTQTSKEEKVYPSQQIYQPLQNKKSNIKLIMVIIAIILIIVIIAIVFIIFIGGNYDRRFVGTWTIQSSGGTTFEGTIIFESNGDLKTGYQGIQISIGKWSTEGDRFCLEYTLGSSYPKICCNYSFYGGGNSLIIYNPTGEGNNLALVK